MNGHAITAWLAVLLRRMGNEGGETGQARSKLGEASHLFIVLDLRAGLLQQLWEVCLFGMDFMRERSCV